MPLFGVTRLFIHFMFLVLQAGKAEAVISWTYVPSIYSCFMLDLKVSGKNKKKTREIFIFL